MPKQLSLDSFVSGRIARTNPIEHTPEFEAALNGHDFVPDTWGGYATRLMDYHDLEPAEAIAALRLTSEQLSDPDILFTTDSYYDPRQYYLKLFHKEALSDFEVEARRLRGVVDLVMTAYLVGDEKAASEQADQLQAQISNRELEEDKIDLACARRDSLISGVQISMDEFVQTMLGANVIDEEHPSELATQWIQSIKDVVEDTCREYFLDEEVKASDIVLGREAFTFMKRLLSPGEEAYRVADENWNYIKPVFIARPLKEFSLIAGTES